VLIFFVLINVSKALIITHVARFLDHSRYIVSMGFVLIVFDWFCFIHSIKGHRACSIFATPGV